MAARWFGGEFNYSSAIYWFRYLDRSVFAPSCPAKAEIDISVAYQKIGFAIPDPTPQIRAR